MKHAHLFSVLVLAATVGACVDETTAPQTNAAKPSLSAQASERRHVVAFEGGVPADFEAAVAALGGTVDLKLNKLGGAVLSGLSADAVAAIAGRDDVQGIEEEESIVYGYQTSEPEATEDVVASASQPQLASQFPRQWNMRAVNAPAAWAAGRLGSSSVTAAILDTGIDHTLPDLSGRVDLARSKSFVPADDALMALAFPGVPVTGDMDGHGTNVATQVASNGVHFAGVTSGTKLIAVKVCGFVPGNCPGGAVVAGLEYAVNQGVAVINMSLGGGFYKNNNGPLTSLFNRAFQYAEQNGVTVVVSAGNAGADMDHVANRHFTYCDQTHVICVSATGTKNAGTSLAPYADQDDPAFYTNFGRTRVDVAAPGGTYTLTPAGAVATAGWVYSVCSRQRMAKTATGYAYHICTTGLYLAGYAGTSQASPHVAGLAALLASEIGKNPPQIRARIARGADDRGQPGTDPYYGSGRINVGNTK